MKKDHDVGTGIGATTGAIAGGIAGSLAGPLGTVAGAALGGMVGAKLGDEAAEMVNPTTYNDAFKIAYQQKPYYSTGRTWEDYSPAYQYGYDTYGQYRGSRFEDVEDRLATGWDTAKLRSRLAWAEAREAVRDGWNSLERNFPGNRQ